MAVGLPVVVVVAPVRLEFTLESALSLPLTHHARFLFGCEVMKHVAISRVFSCHALFRRGGQTVFGKSSNLFYSVGALYFILFFPGFSFTRSNDLVIRESPPVDFRTLIGIRRSTSYFSCKRLYPINLACASFSSRRVFSGSTVTQKA